MDLIDRANKVEQRRFRTFNIALPLALISSVCLIVAGYYWWSMGPLMAFLFIRVSYQTKASKLRVDIIQHMHENRVDCTEEVDIYMSFLDK